VYEIQISLRVTDDRGEVRASIEERLIVKHRMDRSIVVSSTFRASIGCGETTNAAVLDFLRQELGIPEEAIGPEWCHPSGKMIIGVDPANGPDRSCEVYIDDGKVVGCREL
jgi:hypothetical protein